MKRRNKQTRTSMQAPLAILLVAVSTLGIPTASHAESATQKTANVSLPKSTAGEITLSDLRDVGLCVMQIKQQAINIYLEVTRKPISQNANAHMADPMSISITGLDPKAEYLATRPEWLTFYVTTMEPILHLFKEDVKDAETGVQKITVPKGTKDRFEKLFDQYETAVEQLNKHVSVIYDQIAVPKNNVRIAEEAVKIFELANEIEKDRQQVFRLVQSAEGGEVEQVILKKKTE